MCNGFCSVSAPPDPAVCAVIEVSVDRSIVRVGEDITITWNALTEFPESCRVTYPGGTETFTSSRSGVDGELTVTIEDLGTAAISVACPSGSDRQNVQVVPRVQET